MKLLLLSPICFTLHNIPHDVNHYAIYDNKTLHVSSYLHLFCVLNKACLSQIMYTLFRVFFHWHAEGL